MGKWKFIAEMQGGGQWMENLLRGNMGDKEGYGERGLTRFLLNTGLGDQTTLGMV